MSQFFETIKVNRGFIHDMRLHEDRLKSTILKNFGKCEDINFKPLIKPIDKAFYRCKIHYSNRVEKVEFIEQKKRFFKSFKIVHDNSLVYDFKYSDRKKLEQILLERENCDDVIIVKNSLLTDTTIANIALFINGVWITPKKPLFKGIIRTKLLKSGFLKRRDLRVCDFKKCKKFAIMNSLVGFLEIKDFIIKE
ncbi:MAG: aminotransferase class IV [Campylobacterales bacterium]|nr:aminotransferase class IV [Campylobacterales bacterium]